MSNEHMVRKSDPRLMQVRLGILLMLLSSAPR
jgi:hypothetical protein